MPKCDFNKAAKQLKCCIISEHLLLGTPMAGCFCTSQNHIQILHKRQSAKLARFLEGLNSGESYHQKSKKYLLLTEAHVTTVP